jgi:hypothetical protein
LELSASYDYRVVNDDLLTAIDEVADIIQREKAKRRAEVLAALPPSSPLDTEEAKRRAEVQGKTSC